MPPLKKPSIFLAAVFALAVALPVLAQKTPSPPPEAKQEPKAAKPEDVASAESIVAALYDVISGPAGQKRDWDRMRSLFAPEAKMGLTAKRPNGEVVRRSFTPEEYITMNAKALEEGGFFEKEIAKHVDRYGQMAQVFTSYEARRALTDEKPFMRGINHLLLWNDGKRWWILNIFWQAETPDNPVPEKFLKGDG